VTKTEQYRANADMCDKEAAKAQDPEVKRQFSELASQWRDLAKHAERPVSFGRLSFAPLRAWYWPVLVD
jgi:hypothetical protein